MPSRMAEEVMMRAAEVDSGQNKTTAKRERMVSWRSLVMISVLHFLLDTDLGGGIIKSSL